MGRLCLLSSGDPGKSMGKARSAADGGQELVPGQHLPFAGAILIDDFPILFGLFRAGSRCLSDNLADALDTRHAGGNLLFSGTAPKLPLCLLQHIGLWLGQSAILGLVRGQEAHLEGAVIQKDVDAAEIRAGVGHIVGLFKCQAIHVRRDIQQSIDPQALPGQFCRLTGKGHQI